MALDEKTQKQVDKAATSAQKTEQKRNISILKDHVDLLEIEDTKIAKAVKAEFKAAIAKIKQPF